MRELWLRGKFKMDNNAKISYLSKNQIDFVESKIHNIKCIDFFNDSEIMHVSIMNGQSCITLFIEDCEIFEIQQFTGLLDKNDTKVFEGDILKNDDCGDGFDAPLHYEVIYNEQLAKFELVEIGYPITSTESGYDYIRKAERLEEYVDIEKVRASEVIGNIYDRQLS